MLYRRSPLFMALYKLLIYFQSKDLSSIWEKDILSCSIQTGKFPFESLKSKSFDINRLRSDNSSNNAKLVPIWYYQVTRSKLIWWTIKVPIKERSDCKIFLYSNTELAYQWYHFFYRTASKLITAFNAICPRHVVEMLIAGTLCSSQLKALMLKCIN